jgi:pilus assembly protein CpaD
MTLIVSTSVSRSPVRRLPLPVLLVLTASLVSGCALVKRDHIEVGSIPDDYRTNHPIVVGEATESIDIAVASGDYGMTRSQRDAVDGFMYRYDRSAAPPVMVMAPSGSANAAAATNVASDISRHLRKNGYRNVEVVHYAANAPDVSAPIRVAYNVVKATTGQCGRWPDDLLATSENKHWANFGCSYQNNLAAQVANPNDLVGPRQPSEIDAENRSVAIDEYQTKETTFTQNIDY